MPHHTRGKVKAASSHDELLRELNETSRDPHPDARRRAASSEELLDGRHASTLFHPLSPRHRSNSMDFRFFGKDLTLGFWDRNRKARTKDPSARRRSWAVEDRYRSGDTPDVAIVLDVPPKLPPKRRLPLRSSDVFFSSENNKKFGL